ncbi:MAG: T9SS type A sorting domain-containing protein [Colwellia sp.]|nr:T9SS type A sorting domain-containing protein [Colwellia sp.]
MIEIVFGTEDLATSTSFATENSGKIYIFDSQAKLIYEKEFEGTFTKFGVNLADFSSGIYFVTLITDDALYKSRFVKK